jgi:hypothetical protein
MGSRIHPKSGCGKPAKYAPERGGEINVSPQDHNLIFEFSRGTRAEEFSATRIEQRYLVTPLPSLRKRPSY